MRVGYLPEHGVGVKEAWSEDESHMATVVDHDRQGQASLLTDGAVKSCTVVEFASGKDHAQSTLISARDSAHSFSMCANLKCMYLFIQLNFSVYGHTVVHKGSFRLAPITVAVIIKKCSHKFT